MTVASNDKYQVTLFKSLKVALKELEPFIRNGEHLRTGKPFKKFGDMRSREMLANWLLCAAINAIDNRELTFSTDPTGGDGIIHDPGTDETWRTEHVIASQLSGKMGGADALILRAIEHKLRRGPNYAVGKTLIVFLEAGAGEWFPNKITQHLPDPLHFAAIWVVGLIGVIEGAYVYNVVALSDGGAPVLCVRLGKHFDTWTVLEVIPVFGVRL